MATLTYRFTNQEMDALLADLARAIVDATTAYREATQWCAQSITAENLADGRLVLVGDPGGDPVPGGPPVAPWPQELFDHYQYQIALAVGILQGLATGTPPAVEAVQSWRNTYRG